LKILNHLIGTPHDQLITANYMWSLGLGPKVWGLTCWESQGAVCTVFVVEHVSGRPPRAEECTEFLQRLTELNERSRLRVLIPRWQDNPDFAPPNCNGNLIYSEALGRAQYVDFQNFGLTGRGNDVDPIASTGSAHG
jgi:hypothetical protein